MGNLGAFDLSLFLLATFTASLVAGLAGFAFGIIAAAVWLHVLTPVQTATLIVAFGLIVQGYAVWKLRGSLRLNRLLPFFIGGAIGVPAGVALLRYVSAAHMRAGVGVVLIAFSLYSLARPTLPKVERGGRSADGAVGVLNGILGGATGLAGIVVVIWCGLRGWPNNEQRAVFQPVGVAVFAFTAVSLGGAGLIDTGTIGLFALGLPALLVGMWLGMRLYGGLNERGFRLVVLCLLLISGVALLLR